MKTQQFSKILLAGSFLIIFFLVITTIGCNQIQTNSGQEDTFHKIKREGILRVGYILASPWCFRDPKTGELKGTFVETVEEIARQMEVKVEFTESTFSTFIAGLLTKKYDLSIAPTFSTIPRAKSVAFSIPLMAAGNSAIIRKDELRFTTLADIDQERIVVAVTQGEQGHEYAKANFKKAEIRVLSGGDQNLTFSEVLAGRADVALGDAWFSSKFAAEHSEAKDLFAKNPYNITPVAWSVRYEDTSLLVFINTALEYLDTIGKLSEIDKKYDAHWLRPKRVWEKS
ncbi:MAG TPA: substrate-binding periplasmic protein [Candidatus Wunengus sp. YC63]|uniref:substrate-binding periplasmic protein n=1 Tax=Candidatus Wunengus sp. YC63 TaxID=3367699 RepID=UPI004024C306